MKRTQIEMSSELKRVLTYYKNEFKRHRGGGGDCGLQMWGEKMEGEIERLSPNKYSKTEITHIIRGFGLAGWTRCEHKSLNLCVKDDRDEENGFSIVRRMRRWVVTDHQTWLEDNSWVAYRGRRDG